MRTIAIIILCLFAWNNSTCQILTSREKVEQIYLSQVGVIEITGHNDGVEVEQYLSHVGFGKGYAWCAAFCSWVYDKASISNPRNAWVPSWFTNKNNIIWKPSTGLKNRVPLPGDVFGLYYVESKRIGHIGFIHRFGESITITVEGNTNNAGSNEGDGVYMKRRPTRQIYIIARFIKD